MPCHPLVAAYVPSIMQGCLLPATPNNRIPCAKCIVVPIHSPLRVASYFRYSKMSITLVGPT